ncbi:hypothetical protein PENTCL1PPCAC_20944, partial [Pristionchus entomophagus]
VSLQSSDELMFTVDLQVLKQSRFIRECLKLDSSQSSARSFQPLRLSKVNGHLLKLILDWCEHYEEHLHSVAEFEENAQDEWDKLYNVPEWDKEFLKEVDHSTRLELLAAANYLDIDGLKDVVFRSVAYALKQCKPTDADKFNFIDYSVPHLTQYDD